MGKFMGVIALGICAFIFLAGIAFVLQLLPQNENGKDGKIIIHGSTGESFFFITTAGDVQSRSQGLSGKSELSKDHAMLFKFPIAGLYGFWMKDMQFPIDIIWIRGDKIVGITEGVAPEPGKDITKLTLYYPPEPVDYVLEINAGLVHEYNIQTKNTVVIE